MFELAHTLRSFLRVKLRHAQVVEHFSATHRVAEMRLPAVGGIDVGHRSGDAAFSHHGVRFAEQRFADDADAHALRQRFNRCAQSRAAGANHQNIVLMCFKSIESLCARAQKILTSRNTPLATMRI